MIGTDMVTHSKRFRPKRPKGFRHRSLHREALNKIRMTASEEEYQLLIAECWRQFRELASNVGRQGIDPNG
jgi:hypothetical protein